MCILCHPQIPGVQEARRLVTMGVEAERNIPKLTSVFHHLPIVSHMQLCAFAHQRCICEAGTLIYHNAQSGYFPSILVA